METVPEVVLLIFAISCCSLILVRAEKIFYVVNRQMINTEHISFNNWERWDRYSWFLNLADKRTEALQANQNAIKCADAINSDTEKFPGIRDQQEELLNCTGNN